MNAKGSASLLAWLLLSTPLLAATGDPVSIQLRSPRSLLAVGATVQLQVVGTFADGSTADLTAAATGTTYAAAILDEDNPVLTVDANGLATALREGVQIVYAFHGDLAASLPLTVATGADSDGDGMPDAWEIAHGLDPNNPADAAQDPDGDGLTNLQEFLAGTDPHNADTDGDGLADSRELALRTDPLNPDTDGDGLSDGQEVALGTDPLSPDTDRDGIPDGQEVANGTDPLTPEPPFVSPKPILGAGCFVSALNRTAPVQPDGSWVLPNVPSNVGPVRVRATCPVPGGLRSGQSDLVNVPTNGVLRVAAIDFASPQPVPTSLRLAAPVSSLTAPGQTLQLAAVATYPGGATTDVTAGSSGTSYRSSNPAIASVDNNGLVTAAASSGTVLLSAVNEGALGIFQVQVVLSADSDGDGLPDDYEIANGLDPNNPADALADPDHDGLTNLQEFQLGTNPQKADTDGDGLSDGAEVNLYHTNPLLFDTDGDGVSDGLEVSSGSDPLDPNSVNLGPILQALIVQPSTLDIVFNTVMGEASRRLDVKAQLIDGTVIDVRHRRYGTNYNSSDLTVANFGAEDGVVFAGQDGTATVTVSLGSRSANVLVRVTSFSPQALSFLSLPGFANGVDVAGSYAYVASGAAGLVVVDASNPESPFVAATLALPGNANDLKVSAGYAYVAADAAGLVIVDVHNPTAPVLAGRLDTPGTATDLAVKGGRAYIADGYNGLFIADVTNPAAPVRLGAIDTPGNARGVDSDGRIAVVADDYAGLEVIDVSNPATPVQLGSTPTRSGFFSSSHAASVVLRGRYAYVADGAGFNLGGLRTIDVSQPATPVLVGSTSDAFALTSVVLDGYLALTSDVYFVNAVPIFDVGGTTPIFSADVDFSRAPSFRDDNGNDVAVNNNGLVFMVGARWDITDDGVVGDSGLHIGRYKIVEDTAGIQPEVSLTAPAKGASALERDLVTVTASATDDIQVASVQFFMDGVLVDEDFRAPYQVIVRAPVGASSFTLKAVATDLGGNHSESEPLVVAVIPDEHPKVEITTPLAGARLTEAATAEMAATATDDIVVASVELFVDGASQGFFTSPPYRTAFSVPLGATQVTLAATATDNVGQMSTTTRVVAVDPDPPPTVAVLTPAAGSQVIQGARLVVAVGASDNVGVAQVHLDANGQPVGDLFAAPYIFALQVPADAADLHLAATATDNLGHTATVEIVVSIIPDPLTTAVGRVLDTTGQAVAGATVECVGRTGVSDAAGAFTVSGIPTLTSRIACSARGGPGGQAAGTSAAAPPVPSGTTQVGDIVISGHLLYLGSGSSFNFDQPGRLLVLDEAGGQRLVDWSRSIRPQGISGLAFDGAGALWATTQPERGGEVQVARKGKRSTSPRLTVQAGTSLLLRLDPDSGATISTLGPFTEGETGPVIGLQDLTYVPATGGLFSLSAGFFGRSLLFLDLSTQVGRVVTPDLPFSASGLALGPDGFLYLFVPSFEGSQLWTIDPATGAVTDVKPVTGSVGASSSGGEIGGMVLRPGTNRFVLTSPSDGTSLYELDLATLAITEVATPAGDLGGAGLRALAFRPVSETGGTETTARGLVVDPDGNPVFGADVISLGATASTGSDGRFELPNLRVPTGTVRVEVTLAGDSPLAGSSVLTPGVPPVAGGVTDLGTIILGAPACVTGSFQSNRCAQGPVSGTFDLYVDDGTGQLSLIDHILTDPTGRFCATLRRNFFYVARREDVACRCGTVSPCQTYLTLTDPEATGSCGDPTAVCQDLGNIFLDCDFFCGS